MIFGRVFALVAAYECVYIFISLRALLLCYNVAEPWMCLLLLHHLFLRTYEPVTLTAVLIKQTDQLGLLQHSVIHFQTLRRNTEHFQWNFDIFFRLLEWNITRKLKWGQIQFCFFFIKNNEVRKVFRQIW